jgi:very-short-patch-repair endonuclease/transcription elongation GreA/GreB family factor
MSETKDRLIDLFDYVSHMMRLGEKPTFQIKEYRQPFFHEEAFKNKPGITHNIDSETDTIWLKIERLKRINPPKAPDDIQEWISVSIDPKAYPKTENIITQTISEKEAHKLLKDGVLLQDDIQPGLKEEKGSRLCDVHFRLSNLPEIKNSIEQYISGPWQEWSEAEKPRRETIKTYETFFSLQQDIETQGPEKPLELVWGVGVACWLTNQNTIDHPIVEQLVEIEICDEDGAILIRPRGTAPRAYLNPFFALNLPGAQTVRDFAKNFFDELPEDDVFSPFITETFTPVLRRAAIHIDQPNGEYYPDVLEDKTDRSLPSIRDNLVITDTWVIYARRRSDNFIINDLENLKKAINQTEDIPGPVARLVNEPSDQPDHIPGRTGIINVGLRGAAASGTFSHNFSQDINNTCPEDFFFPKPYNNEQVLIVQRLEKSDGVVVQGPPGTGKTHTIANIICHYLATGRRVLVTSKGESALAVLRDHIPDNIRELTISLLTNEREGLAQLEKSVDILSKRVKTLVPDDLKREIIDTQRRILNLKQQITAIDNELYQWAEKHLKPLSPQNQMLPIDLAKRVFINRDKHVWFPDRPAGSNPLKFKPQFTDNDIHQIRIARKLLGSDLRYAQCKLPNPGDLPDQETVKAIHQNLVNADALENKAQKDNFPSISMTVSDAFQRAENLLALIKEIISFLHKTASDSWLRSLFMTWWKHGLKHESNQLFDDLIPLLRSISEKRLVVVGYAVEMPDDAVMNSVVCEGIERAATGKRPFGMMTLGKTPEKNLLKEIRIEGRNPDSQQDWKKILTYLQWRKELTQLCSRWRVISSEFNLCELQDKGNATGLWISEKLRLIEDGQNIATNKFKELSNEIDALFSKSMDAEKIISSVEEAEKAAEIVDLILSKNLLLRSRSIIETALTTLEKCSGDIVQAFQTFFKTWVGQPQYTANNIADRYREIMLELDRLTKLQPAMQTVRRVVKSVHQSGAKKWAVALLNEKVEHVEDPWTPADWKESWTWTIHDAYLKLIDGRKRIQSLSENRLKLDNDLKKAFEKVVELRTFWGLKQRLIMNPGVTSALVMFTKAIRDIGRGTGIRAHRFRKDARDAMEKSYAAVPCWIMPTWRVSENFPPQIGSFDLVIVDEASQSDIMALPALVRAKKLLIVGDDKQVSPTAAFIEEKELLRLKHNYLKGQPFTPLLLPGASLYDLASAVFPNEGIMLQEHFRCVEPIIRFSMQFYNNKIIPLRIPKASERLTPSLIDVYVPHGAKTRGQLNHAEADAIVEEIVKIIEEPAMVDRTIGVVSLIGAKQAHYIQTLLLSRIGEKFLRHRIACGDSATFQGKERDIMFISMVECPKTKSARTSLMFQQRFNVALSRARDRMYLYRSVTDEMLRPDDLKAKVIRHFKSPMEGVSKNYEELIELCDSDFEREFFTTLTQKGYKVTPQVQVGPYRIDMVVEGAQDNRLAIELDGDQYHPPHRWAEDYKRQQILERVGWRFWRCWGSSYTLDPEGCIENLIETLTALGIEPLADKDTAPNIFTEHRVVKLDKTADKGKMSESDLNTDQDQGFNRGENPDVQSRVAEKTTLDSFKEDLIVEVGDRILIAYNDEPQLQHTIRISATEHDPDMKIIRMDMPLAKALLNSEINEEVEIPAGGTTRVVTIINIDKAIN